MMRDIVASFDEALELFVSRYGPVPSHIAGAAPHMFGAADAPGGFHARSDLGERSTVDGRPLNALWDEFNRRLRVFNRQHDIFIRKVTFPVTVTNDRVLVPRRARMEEASEFGKPALIRTERVARGYYLNHFDVGFGFTKEYLDDSSAEDIQGLWVLAEEAWTRRRRQTVLELLFGSANFTDAKEGINVKRLYNADGEVPPEYEGYTHDGTHTHYLYSAGTSFAVADVTAMETHLLHHGYGDLTGGGAGGDLELHAPRAVVAAIRGFTGFIPAASASIVTELSNSGVLVGRRPGGDNAEGYLGRFAIIENNAIPSGYMLGLATGGEFVTQNPVGLREHVNPSARGLVLNAGRQDYPLQDSYYDGYVGGGVRHRAAAVCMYEDTGNGDVYVDPTF